MNKKRFELIIYIFLLSSFIQPERFISNYVPLLSPINAINTIILYLIILLWYINSKNLQKNAEIPLIKIILLMVFSMILSTIFAKNTGRARNVTIPMVYFAITYYIIVGYYIINWRNLLKIINLYFLAIFCLGLTGIFYGGKIPFIPELNDEDSLGPLFTMITPFAWGYSLQALSLKKKIWYTMLCSICIIAVAVSHARGASIALVAVIIYMFILHKRKLLFALIVVCLASVIILFNFKEISENSYYKELVSIFDEKEMIENKEGTGASRMFLWKMGLLMFEESPIIGVGPLNFGVHLPELAEKYRDEKVGLAYYGQIIHNDYLEILIGTGLFGFIVLIILMFSAFKMNLSTRQVLQNIKKIENSYSLKNKCSYIDKLIIISHSITAAQIAFNINMLFYGLIYYRRFFWHLLIMSAGLNIIATNIYRSKKNQGYKKSSYGKL